MSGIGLEQTIGEILAVSRESLGVSRVRCYAMDSNGVYRLSASYGFSPRSAPAEALEPVHPLIEWVVFHRKPAFANSLRDAGVLAPLMQRERYARSLAAPVYVGSRLVGIIELQDKLGNVPFGAEDVRQVQRICSRIARALGHLDGVAVGGPEPLPEEDREALFLHPERGQLIEFPPAPDLFSSIAEAAPETPGLPTKAAPEAAFEQLKRERTLLKAFANAVLMSPEIDAVVFSLWGPERAALSVAARRPLSAAARSALFRNLESALLAASPRMPLPAERSIQADFPLGRGTGEIPEPAGIQTSVIFSESDTLLLSLVFSRPPAAGTEDALKDTHRLVRASIMQVRGGERYHRAYRSLVDALLEPGQKKYPQLKSHCRAVGALTRRFANVLRLPAVTVEQFTVAALLHDIGLRELEIPYERLSGRRPLDLQELTIVRQHAAVGASLLSRIDFPYPVSPLVWHHHERFDGTGYPDRLAGDKIPFGSRVIAITEAYDAMVSPHSYRSPVSRDAALDTISGKGGSQFDPELARRFCELIRATAAFEDVEPLPEIGP